MSEPALTREVACHNDEELVKISRDLIAYCSEGLTTLQERHGGIIPRDLWPHVDLYKNTMATCREFLMKKGLV